MGKLGFLTKRGRQLGRSLEAVAGRFRRDRKSSTAVEFAIVGSVYFFVLFVVVEGGIFYLLTTTLDFATELASRSIMIDQGVNTDNNNSYTAAPATPAALESLIQANSYGVLNVASITVEVQMAGPVTGATRAAGTGFQAIPAVATPDGTTYQFLPGSCTVDYSTTSVNGAAPSYTLNSTGACTTGKCAATYFSRLPNEGEVSGGTDVTTTSGTTVTNTYSNATFSCSGGQDVVVQAQYTDSLLAKLVGYLFGPITSTLAFQVEPAAT
jgi:Flp pilus assembly protein TadG